MFIFEDEAAAKADDDADAIETAGNICGIALEAALALAAETLPAG